MKDADIGAVRLTAFASPAFAVAALGLPVVAILPPLYAELGLGLTAVGTIFMLARFFDVFTDPLFGVLGDRVNTRWGRRKPAILIAIPITAYGAYRVFMPALPVTGTDLLISMLVLYVGWTMLTLAHTAWASELSTDYDRRSRIMGFIQFCGLVGSVVVLLVPTLVDFFVPDADMQLRSKLMGWLILIALPVFCLVALFSVKDRPVAATVQLPWRAALASIIENRALRRLLLADLLMGLQGGINGSVHFFFIGQVLLLPRSASLFLVVIFITGLLCVPLFMRLSYRLGKHRTLCWGAIVSSFATATLFVVPAGNFWAVFVVFALIGVNIGTKDFLMRSMMADVIDQDRVNVGTERSALYYSMLTLTAKLGFALAVGIIYPVLDWVGFDPAGVNDQATIDGVRLVVATSPTLVTICVAIIMWRFPIDRARQQALREELAAR
jgi:GPH family glycoside/pentoside/hexuronide:cation symporter